jgi:hypothetical protein
MSKLGIDIFYSNGYHKKQYYVDAEKTFIINSGKFIGNTLIYINMDNKKSVVKTFTVDFNN